MCTTPSRDGTVTHSNWSIVQRLCLFDHLEERSTRAKYRWNVYAFPVRLYDVNVRASMHLSMAILSLQNRIHQRPHLTYPPHNPQVLTCESVPIPHPITTRY
ncbi:unnamed protein product [Choristocarpus tenellus]